MPEFYNPYGFIPPDDPSGARTYSAESPSTNPLGQGLPAGHDRYHAGLWSGRIEIEIEAATPLLIPEAVPTRGARGEHKVFRTRRRGKVPIGTVQADAPHLPVTSFKGPLRAAYEAITNSRLGVFRDHGAPLARRMAVDEGLVMVPARIVGSGGTFSIELLRGTSDGYPSWDILKNPASRRGAEARWVTLDPRGEALPLFTAWLPRYKKGERGGVTASSPKFSDGCKPEHRDVVHCCVELWEKRPRSFKYWRVRQIDRLIDV